MLRSLLAATLGAGLLSGIAAAPPSRAPRVDTSGEPAFRSRVEQLASDFDLVLQVDDLARARGYLPSDNPFERITDSRADREPRTGGACIAEACRRAGDLRCEQAADIERAGRACRGNAGAACLKKACGFLPEPECQSFARLAQLTRSCRGLSNLGCVDHVCHQLGNAGCDTAGEVAGVLEACR